MDPNAITPEEVQWCHDLREALAKEGVPEAPGGDFMLAHFALIGKGDAEDAVKRVMGFHKIVAGDFGYSTESAEQNALGFMNKTFPGMLLPCGTDAEMRPILTSDARPYLPKTLGGDPELIRALFHDFLLFADAYNCDLHRMRGGMTFVTLCEGMGWQNFDAELEKQAAPLYQDAYPMRRSLQDKDKDEDKAPLDQGRVPHDKADEALRRGCQPCALPSGQHLGDTALRFKKMIVVGAGPIINAMLEICKVFLKKKVADRIVILKDREAMLASLGADLLPPEMGGTLEGAVSYEDMLIDGLRRRRESIATFRLPPPPETLEVSGLTTVESVRAAEAKAKAAGASKAELQVFAEHKGKLKKLAKGKICPS